MKYDIKILVMMQVTHRTATPKLNRVVAPETSEHGKLTVDTVKIWGTHDEVCQITKLRSNKLIIKKWTDGAN